jgi:glycerophosphoryl diester phosphodiesterase
MLGGGFMIRGLCAGLLVLAVACSSSSGPPPIDPLATEYCAACSVFSGCEELITKTLNVVCPDETHAWYACVTDNACDETPCETEWAARNLCLGTAPRDEVRVRIFGVRVFDDRCSANIGYRGTGPTREGHPLPENSISSFLEAMDKGADGVQLDAAITQDGKIVVMHDDTLDRTTNCTGCVSAMTLNEIQACRLLDGAGSPTDEPPPTLLEVYSAVDSTALINLQLKVFEPPCLTDMTGREQLVPAALEEVARIGGEARTIFSSLDAAAATLVKAERPGYYSAIVSDETGQAEVEQAVALQQDAIHPGASVSAETVQSARDADLQVNVLVVDTADLTDEQIAALMEEQIAKGSTAIIANEPAILADVLAAHPPPCP